MATSRELGKFLLRHGCRYFGKTHWMRRHFDWIRARHRRGRERHRERGALRGTENDPHVSDAELNRWINAGVS